MFDKIYCSDAVDFLRNNINNCSVDLVLDPMCGSGTVCAEAKKNKRHFIGIDINQDYCNISNNILGIVNASS